jgi:hypothetical protein
MNERIKELVDQATSHMLGRPPYDSLAFDVFDKEKFAELIVRECVGRVTSKANGWGDMTGFAIKESILDCANDLKQHFGVEE